MFYIFGSLICGTLILLYTCPVAVSGGLRTLQTEILLTQLSPVSLFDDGNCELLFRVSNSLVKYYKTHTHTAVLLLLNIETFD